MAVGGALFELESILKVPDAARIGWWTMEWWWNQPELPEVKAFDDAMRSRTGKAASARNWFGYAAVRTLAQSPTRRSRSIAVVLARALQDYTLPADIALSIPTAYFFRDRDHELMSTILSAKCIRRKRAIRSTCSPSRPRCQRRAGARTRRGERVPARLSELIRLLSSGKLRRAGRAGSAPCGRRSDRPAD